MLIRRIRSWWRWGMTGRSEVVWSSRRPRKGTIRPPERRTSSDATSQEVPKELIERGARLAIDSGRPVAHVAKDIGLPSETLRKTVRCAEAAQGLRPDLPMTEEREEIRRLKRENADLRCANEILMAASVSSRDRARRRPTEVSAFIAEHRARFGVEPICRTLGGSARPIYSAGPGGARPTVSRTSG